MNAHEYDALSPHDVPHAQAIIRRLCHLQRDVAEVIDPRCNHAMDCFCGESGYWPLRSPARYKNELLAIEFIEEATRAALARVQRDRWIT